MLHHNKKKRCRRRDSKGSLFALAALSRASPSSVVHKENNGDFWRRYSRGRSACRSSAQKRTNTLVRKWHGTNSLTLDGDMISPESRKFCGIVSRYGTDRLGDASTSIRYEIEGVLSADACFRQLATPSF